jgi:thiol-disulfide isomerase/thioredoxin
MKWSHQLIIAVVAMLAIAAGFFSYRTFTAGPRDGPDLPHFSFPDVAGVQRDRSEWDGKTLVINFWATWCPPCREEIPEFIKLQEEMGGLGLQFIGIAIEDTEPVEAFMAEMTFNYPVLIGEDDGMSLSAQLGNTIGILPFTAVIDRSGKVVHAHSGPFNREQVMAIVKPLLAGDS